MNRLRIRRLNTAAVYDSKPSNRAEALAYIEKHTKYRPEHNLRTFAINVKLWNFNFQSQLERDATFALIRGSEFMDFYIDWNSIAEFNQKYGTQIEFHGRSAGWMCLMAADIPGRPYGFGDEDTLDESPFFARQYRRHVAPICQKIADERLESVNRMFSNKHIYRPHTFLQFVLEHLTLFQKFDQDGNMFAPTSALHHLTGAPKREDWNDPAWESFTDLVERFKGIDTRNPKPQISSKYMLVSTKELLHIARVLWDFNQLAEVLADYTVATALEEYQQAEPV